MATTRSHSTNWTWQPPFFFGPFGGSSQLSEQRPRLLDTAQDPYYPVSVSLVLCPSELPHLHHSTLAPVPGTSCSSLLCPTAYFVQLAFTQQNSPPPPQPVRLPALLRSLSCHQPCSHPLFPAHPWTPTSWQCTGIQLPSLQLHSCHRAQGPQQH